ncbi:MAG: S8 family serine peptidase, partial [Bacteroidales bacterium]
VERRIKQGIKITETDLPLSDVYVGEILKLSGREVCHSNWMNTLVVESSDSLFASVLDNLPFVKDVEKVFEEPYYKTEQSEEPVYFGRIKSGAKNGDYGDALMQIEVHGGDKLHKEGFRGEGVTIAVLDGGFKNVNILPEYFDIARIAGTRDFVNPGGDLFLEHLHGENILSLMLACKKGSFIGTAPHADYYLLRTEEYNTEFPCEEDRWVRGAEYADSLGVDIIISSLGYTVFDNKKHQYTNKDLNGKTAFSSRGATIAARTGIIVITSAGNERGKTWHKITFPGDADSILTVGGIDRDMEVSEFSSRGYRNSNKVKPDVMALATSTALVKEDGSITTSNGSSFATPIIAGLTACLWQALPHLNAQQIIALIRRHSNNFYSADEDRGYGVPNFYSAYKAAVNDTANIKHNTSTINR